MAVLDYTTEAMLREWGKWIRMGKPNPRGAKSWLGVLVDRMVEQNSRPGLCISEDKVETFDRQIMNPIKQNSRKAYFAMEYYYSDEDATVESLAKRLKIRTQTASDLLRLGRELVECLVFEA